MGSRGPALRSPSPGLGGKLLRRPLWHQRENGRRGQCSSKGRSLAAGLEEGSERGEVCVGAAETACVCWCSAWPALFSAPCSRYFTDCTATLCGGYYHSVFQVKKLRHGVSKFLAQGHTGVRGRGRVWALEPLSRLPCVGRLDVRSAVKGEPEADSLASVQRPPPWRPCCHGELQRKGRVGRPGKCGLGYFEMEAS